MHRLKLYNRVEIDKNLRSMGHIFLIPSDLINWCELLSTRKLIPFNNVPPARMMNCDSGVTSRTSCGDRDICQINSVINSPHPTGSGNILLGADDITLETPSLLASKIREGWWRVRAILPYHLLNHYCPGVAPAESCLRSKPPMRSIKHTGAACTNATLAQINDIGVSSSSHELSSSIVFKLQNTDLQGLF